jgi:hypothetical protein
LIETRVGRVTNLGVTKVRKAVADRNFSPKVSWLPIIFAKTSIERLPAPLT